MKRLVVQRRLFGVSGWTGETPVCGGCHAVRPSAFSPCFFVDRVGAFRVLSMGTTPLGKLGL